MSVNDNKNFDSDGIGPVSKAPGQLNHATNTYLNYGTNTYASNATAYGKSSAQCHQIGLQERQAQRCAMGLMNVCLPACRRPQVWGQPPPSDAEVLACEEECQSSFDTCFLDATQ